MILSDTGIRDRIQSEELAITPFNPDALQPASLDCCLGNHYLLVDEYKMGCIQMDQPIEYREIIADSFTLPPHSFVLATTQEHVRLPNNLTAFVEGRSSIGRMGLFVQNAGWVDAGFEGKITLELYNANSLPIQLLTGRRVCQLVFCTLDQAAEHGYNGKYQGQSNAVGSRIYQDNGILS
ncbi:dCTP deaminase [bacterium]|jgi:dCTP deaminase|nr:dCTP deaminase [bacterium]|tara:strand:+ start:2231 stop:2770 length:540 start_codon:yes stop_codon:yes gene_type:complete